MIERLIAFSGRNGFVVILLIAAIVGGGVWSLRQTPIDAVPDLSDVQVIIMTNWEGRSPTLVEDQITYPIVTSLISAPKVKVVRGFSYFDVSFVYVIFEDGTDPYWARTRVLEYMSALEGRLPEGVRPNLGPDASGVGWAYEYALVDKTGKHDLAQLRSLNDWSVQYWLRSVPGVAEVAPYGGFVKQYQIEIDPNALTSYSIPIDTVVTAVRKSNNDVGGRVVEWTGREYMVRGRGYIKDVSDIEQVSLGARPDGTPILVRDVARVHIGPEIRRGVADLNGEGDVAAGIVVVRQGVDTYGVIQDIKKTIKEKVQPALPEGVEIVTTYDRSTLIERSIDTLKGKLIEELVIVSVVCIIFLWHLRSAFVAILTLPLSILLAFVAMHALGIGANIMSLGGIAIAMGAMIDAAIIMIENAHKHIEHDTTDRPRHEILIEAAQQVGRPLFFSLLIITVSFLPIFSLEAQEGRLFRPLAFTKTFSMGFAALTSVMIVPFLMVAFIRGKIPKEEKNPINRFLMWAYHPFVRLVLRHRVITLLAAAALMLGTVPVFMKLGSEFMPPLDEGTILYMPITLPGASIETARQALQTQDKLIMQVPEVDSVSGKAGRALSATDPAPPEMFETVINLKPESQWRPGMTTEKIEAELDRVVRVPGVANAWTMPIKARTDMLSTGIRTPVGIKIFGPDLAKINDIGSQLEAALSGVPGSRNVFAERVTGGYYLDFTVKRDQIARYGLSVEDVEMAIESAIGGANVTTTIEGRERYPVNVRYQRAYRTDLDAIRRTLISTPSGAQIPMEQVADITTTTGPTVLRTEQAQLLGYVYVDVGDRDLGGYVNDAKKAASTVKIPSGYTLEWSGQYEYMERATERLKIVIPVTLALVIVLLYFSTKNATKVGIVLLAVPFSLIGAFWLLFLLHYNLSVAVWVGIIALAGVDAETGVVMLLYLDQAYERAKGEGRMKSMSDLRAAVEDGAVKRIRPKMMTVMAILMGLLPIMWSHGAGADVMKRIAAPMVGGVITSFVLELLIYPVIFTNWKWWREVKPSLARVETPAA